MRLQRADILNFRSVESATINFEPSCRILVGINESGKSNLIRALSLLDPAVAIAPEDIREPLPGEDPVTAGFVAAARALSPNSLINLLDSVASKSTSHLRSVWKEYKGLEFSLTPNGGEIVPAIKEKTRSNFAQRSDGFKRFVTFLLMISTGVKTRDIAGCLLLIDEPETSLHPSGARYLRDELLKIARTNFVIYSTHSIFMVDQEVISRHLLVSRRNQKTIIQEATDANIVDEEVIYRALGYSAFETLKKKNIAFEGWRDKHVFRLALERQGTSEMAKRFKEVGICHIQGVKQVVLVGPIMEMAGRDLLIVSDADPAAIKKKAEFVAQRGFGKWFTYRDLVPSSNAVTVEDFISASRLLKVAGQFRTENPAVPDLSELELPEGSAKLNAVMEWIRKAFPGDQDLKVMTGRFKELLFSDLRSSDLTESYGEVLQALSRKI